MFFFFTVYHRAKPASSLFWKARIWTHEETDLLEISDIPAGPRPNLRQRATATTSMFALHGDFPELFWCGRLVSCRNNDGFAAMLEGDMEAQEAENVHGLF